MDALVEQRSGAVRRRKLLQELDKAASLDDEWQATVVALGDVFRGQSIAYDSREGYAAWRRVFRVNSSVEHFAPWYAGLQFDYLEKIMQVTDHPGWRLRAYLTAPGREASKGPHMVKTPWGETIVECYGALLVSVEVDGEGEPQGEIRLVGPLTRAIMSPVRDDLLEVTTCCCSPFMGEHYVATLEKIAERHPEARAVLFRLPAGIDQAPAGAGRWPKGTLPYAERDAEICRRHIEHKRSIGELMQDFNRSRSTIKRILRGQKKIS